MWTKRAYLPCRVLSALKWVVLFRHLKCITLAPPWCSGVTPYLGELCCPGRYWAGRGGGGQASEHSRSKFWNHSSFAKEWWIAPG